MGFPKVREKALLSAVYSLIILSDFMFQEFTTNSQKDSEKVLEHMILLLTTISKTQSNMIYLRVCAAPTPSFLKNSK